MMGESKTRESLNGLLRASKVLSMNFGRINVQFGAPLSVKSYTEDYATSHKSVVPSSPSQLPGKVFDPFTVPEDRRNLIHHLGYTLIHTLNKNIAITSTSILSTVLLTHRRGISKEELIIKCHWLREEIMARNAAIAFEGPTEGKSTSLL
jgi:glycerol-3-phosphate O-acyltransferase